MDIGSACFLRERDWRQENNCATDRVHFPDCKLGKKHTKSWEAKRVICPKKLMFRFSYLLKSLSAPNLLSIKLEKVSCNTALHILSHTSCGIKSLNSPWSDSYVRFLVVTCFSPCRCSDGQSARQAAAVPITSTWPATGPAYSKLGRRNDRVLWVPLCLQNTLADNVESERSIK